MASSLKWLCAVPLLWFSACSCGNGPCQHLSDAEAGLKSKAGNCTLTFTEFNEKRCEDKSGQCTNDDYQLIDTAASCLQAMGNCEKSAQTVWLAEVQACHPSVSADCEPAVE